MLLLLLRLCHLIILLFILLTPFTNIPVTYYSSFSISFSLPQSTRSILALGTYSVQVTTINNSTNLFPTTVYSNKVLYTLTP